jgi:hypothetical protein
MNSRNYLISTFFLLSITACSSSPQSLAEKHLDMIKSGKSSQANQQYCMPSETLRLHTVNSFKVSSSQQKTRDNLPYTEVVASIETDQFRFKNVDNGGVIVPKKEVLQQVTLEVWKSDDFYQELVKTTAKLNDLGKSTAALTGTQATTQSVPVRDKVNKDSLCIFLPFDQFESDQ